MSRRRRMFLFAVCVFFFLLLTFFAWLAWPGSSTFTISPETTYVTGPLDANGNVNYVTALNERLSKGITPDKNANVLIWIALGPHPEGGTMPREYFEWLGIGPPPEQGDYFVTYFDDLKKREDAVPPEQRTERLNRRDRVSSGPWAAKDEPELANWLKLNDRPLAVVIEATRRPDYYNPLAPRSGADSSGGLMAALLPNVQVCREVAQALVLRAMLRLNEGDTDSAWQDLLACHRLGRLISRGGTLIEMLVGFALVRIASDADLVFIDKAKLSTKRIQEFRRELEQLPPMASLADHLDLTERFMFLDSATMVAGRGTGNNKSGGARYKIPAKGSPLVKRLFTRSINWDPALRNTNRFFDRCVAAARLTERAARQREMDKIEAEINLAIQEAKDAGVGGWFFYGPTRRGEMIGNVLLGLLMPAFDKIQTAADRNEQTHRNLHLAFALAAFRADTGHYPAKLDELAPKYLDNIPNDLFSDKPLIYKLDGDGYLLYSVGPNGKDDAGKTQDDEPKGDDIAVRMPVSTPGKK